MKYSAEMLPARMKEARKNKGLSQSALAERCGCKQTTISNTESGRSIPDLPNLIKIAQALDVGLDWLCGNELTNNETTAVQWLAYMARLLDDPPRYEDDSPMISYEERKDSDAAWKAAEPSIVFHDTAMREFFKQYKAIESLKQSGAVDEDTILGLQRAIFEKFKDEFTPGYKAPPSDFAALEDTADEKVPF